MRWRWLGFVAMLAAVVPCAITAATALASGSPSGSGEVAATAPAPAQPPGPPPPVDVLEAQLLSMINAERAAAGVGPVQAAGWAHSVAQQHSRDMAAQQNIWHNLSGFIDQGHLAMGAVYLGENVAMDSTLAADDALLYSDPPHRVITLDARFNYVGVGIALDSKNWVYVTEDFAQIPGGAAPVQVTSPPRVAAPAPVVKAPRVVPKAPVVAAAVKPQPVAPTTAPVPTTAPAPAPVVHASPTSGPATVATPAKASTTGVPVAQTTKLKGGVMALVGLAILVAAALYGKRLIAAPAAPGAWAPTLSLAAQRRQPPAWQKAA